MKDNKIEQANKIIYKNQIIKMYFRNFAVQEGLTR